MTLEQIHPYLDEAVELGVKEYYFTGGEPFINKEMEEIIRETLRVGWEQVEAVFQLSEADEPLRGHA